MTNDRESAVAAEVSSSTEVRAPELDLAHREFDDSEFWRSIPAYENLDREGFIDHTFQARASVTSVDQLEETVGDLVDPQFLDDVRRGIGHAPMAIRISPYVISRIDWNEPYTDPLRIQFLPVASTARPDHPMLMLDSLHEQQDSPTSGLVHRYPDKVLFLPLDVCPVYCRFCTRSYAIGSDTDQVDKVDFKPNPKRWEDSFDYLEAHSEIEDVVVSGGDAYILPAQYLRTIGETLLDIPHIRRVRFASKGLAVMPTKILTDLEWTDALVELVEKGRERAKEICLHTHFNHAAEITSMTRDAMEYLFLRGVTVRNQTVLIRGVNDDPAEMIRLIKKLAYIGVEPYYVYQHDMVKHVEDLRTRVGATIELERAVRGTTAGFNTPLFVTDLPGGGGKRDVHSHEHYDEVTGISVYRSPIIDPEKVYLYFDPIHLLPEEGRERWKDEEEHAPMIRAAVRAAGAEELVVAHTGARREVQPTA